VLRPTVVLDLDETVVWRPRGVLDQVLMYGAPWVAVGQPYAGAAACLADISARFNLVAVTARWRLAEASTDAMLARAGLPRLPVIYAGAPHPRDASRAAFKARAIRHLRDEGWAPFAGVGDRASDVEAYAGEGLAALAVVHAEGAAAPAATERAMARLLRAERALRAARPARPPRIEYFTDCPRAAAAAGVAAAAAPVWAQLAARLLAPRA
jgi:hypothetical protein